MAKIIGIIVTALTLAGYIATLAIPSLVMWLCGEKPLEHIKDT